MSKKSDLVQKILSKIEPRWPLPAPLEEATLLEQGLYAVLGRRLEPGPAKRALENLRKAYADYNELRVAQAQEIAAVMQVGKAGVAAAGDVRAYLHEVFQRSHGLDLAFLRDDPDAVKRFAATLPFIGTGLLHYLMWLSSPGDLPITAGMMRVLDRVGVATRISNVKKARAALQPLVKEPQKLELAYKIGEVAGRWCDAKKPLCHECVIVEECRFGRKAYREWRQQQERMEVQRAREEARQAALQRKEDARRKREDARARKKAEAEAKKRAREEQRKAQVAERKRKAEEARQGAQRAREQARQQREQERQRKKAEAEATRKARKQEAERKRAADAKARQKKAARKKAAAKKPATRSGKKAARKPAGQRATQGRATTRKPGTKAGSRSSGKATRATRKGSTTRKRSGGAGTRKGKTRKGGR